MANGTGKYYQLKLSWKRHLPKFLRGGALIGHKMLHFFNLVSFPKPAIYPCCMTSHGKLKNTSERQRYRLVIERKHKTARLDMGTYTDINLV